MADGARDVAAEVLARVWQEEAFAAAALDAELRRRPNLDPRDAALATELVYGVLRTAGALERAIGRHARGDRYRRKPYVRAHMLMAAYTIFFLERVPAFAAVSEAVRAIKQRGGTQVAGFANAVLRKLAGEPKKAERRARLETAVLESIPTWLREAVADALGGEEAMRAYFQPEELVASTGLCVRKGEAREEWLARLREAAPEAEVSAGELSERCILLRNAGDPLRLPGANQAWTVEEQGAQVIALALGARAGDEVLDACAGRGGKTLLLAEEVMPGGAVDAADRHPGKLDRLRAAAAGRPIGLRDAVAVDWTRGSGALEGQSYDRILVDAPCTGTGTLRRRPEIVERLAASDVDRMAAIQLSIAQRAASHLRPGGRMVYAVCSVLRGECEGVVDALVRATDLEPCPFDGAAARALAGDSPTLRLLPQTHATDGFFLASLRRR